jgi:hypothetical protein
MYAQKINDFKMRVILLKTNYFQVILVSFSVTTCTQTYKIDKISIFKKFKTTVVPRFMHHGAKNSVRFLHPSPKIVVIRFLLILK